MKRKKTTVYIDEHVLRATRIHAAREGKRDYQVFEEALRVYLGLDVLERVWSRNDLEEDEALRLAYEGLDEVR